MDQFSANTIQVHLFFVFILAAALLICIIPSLSFIIETIAEQAPYYESDERDYQYNFYEPKEKNYGNEDTYYTSQIPSSYEPEYKLHNEIDKYIQVEPTDNKDNKEIDIEKWFQQSKQKFQQKLDEEKEQQQQQEQQKDQTNEDNNGNIMLKRTYQQKLDHDKKQTEEKEKEEKEKEEKEKEEKEKEEKEKEEKEKEEKEKEEKEGDNSKTSYILNPHFRSFYPPIKQIMIPEIYQSVFNGEKYRFNVTNPNDEIQVDESENKKVFTQQNYDGSWRIDGGSTRIDIHTKDAGIIPDKPLQLNNILNGITVQSWNFSKLKDIGYWYKPSDWKNVEITLIFKLVDSSRSKGDQHSVSLVTRSISHSQLDNDYKKSKNQPQFFCGGSSYHNNLSSDGKVRMKKEQFHIDYEWEKYNPNMNIGDIENIYHKKIGFKGMIYNINETAVKLESWVDTENGGKGPYKKVHEFIDNGNWGDAMIECGAKTVGQAITWGSPTVIIKANDFKLDIYDIEVREIIPPYPSYPSYPSYPYV